jgi:hypothetical protein
MRMECRTRLGLSIFLFGVLLVAVLVLIRQVIPPVRVYKEEEETGYPALDKVYETRYIDIGPSGQYRRIVDSNSGEYKKLPGTIKAKMTDASGNTL